MQKNIKAIAVAVAVLIVLFPLLYSLVVPVVSQGTESAEPFLEIPEGKCVKDATYMRYHHMTLLKNIRDEAVRGGKRGTMGDNGWEITLDNCLKCHTSREQFCAQCHRAVNLPLNCYDCHYDPELVAAGGH